jgi:hypothetical protein
MNGWSWGRAKPWAAVVLRYVLLGPPARTRRAKVTRAALSVALWTIVLFRYEPSLIFAHEYVHPRFIVHSDAPLGSATRTVLDAATERLQRSGIDDPGRVFRVYLCNEAWRMRLLAPLSTEAYAMTNVGTHVVNRCDVSADRVYSGTRSRSLSGTLAHEATHTIIWHRYGTLAAMRLPPWKEEGLCDYVAGESTFPEAEGLRILAEGRDDPSASFFYFKARRMVDHLIHVDGLTIDEVVLRHHDEATVAEALRARLRRAR